MVNRREFMQAAPLGALSLAGLGLPWAAGHSAPASARPVQDMPVDRIVSLVGDNVPSKAQQYPARLTELIKASGDVTDAYLVDGAVGALESQFAALLGKEDAAFMPSGTMANQIAIRLLCGDRSRVLLQKESHVYRDEADAVAIMNAINPVPVDGGASEALYDGMAAAFAQSGEKPYPVDVGAVSIESPVRRLEGAAVPLETVAKIAALAKEKGARMHLDGARLLLLCGSEGFDVERYCAPFDSVYVSLYKYLGAPFGAVLAGDKAYVARARQARHVFGGTIYHGWVAALVASDTLTGFDRRFARVHAEADRLLDLLAATPGIEVERVPHGSNIAFLKLDERVAADLAARAEKANIAIGRIKEGRLRLTFNETLLRKPVEAIAKVFASR